MKNFFRVISFVDLTKSYALLLVFSIFVNILDIGFLLGVYQVVSNISGSQPGDLSVHAENIFLFHVFERNTSDLLSAINFTLWLCLVVYLAKFLKIVVESWFIQKVRKSLIDRSLEASLHLKFGDVLALDFGSVANTVTMRSNLLAAQLIKTVTKFHVGLITLIFMTVLIGITDFYFLLAIIAVAFFLASVIYVLSNRVSALGSSVDDTNRALLSEIDLSFKLGRTIRINKLQGIAADRIKAISHRAFMSLSQLQVLKDTPRLLVEFFVFMGALGGLLLFFGVFNSELDPANGAKIILILLGLQRVFPTLGLANNAFNGIAASKAPFNEYFSFVQKARTLNAVAPNLKVTHGKLKMVQLNDLHFEYHENPSFAVKVEKFDIKLGAVTLINGRSGSGKSTLLYLILKLMQPTSGKITYLSEFNEEIDTLSPKIVEYVSNDEPVFGDSISEYLTSYRLIDVDLRYCEHLFLQFNMYNHWVNRDVLPPRKLSLGERQRLKIIRALANPDMQMIILDEALSNLDLANQEAVVQFIYTEARNKIVIVVSHDDAFSNKNCYELTLN